MSLQIENNPRIAMARAMMMMIVQRQKTLGCYGCNMIMSIDVLNRSMAYIQHEPTNF